MALILNIETATTNCSVAVFENERLLSLVEDNNTKYSHGESLHSYIEKALQDAEASKIDIDAIAISRGPGSYTGLRIGVASAKGLCLALSCPLISVSTLASLARKIKIENGYIIPMLDARRMEVYSAVYDNEYRLAQQVAPQIISTTSFGDYLNDKICHFVGNANNKTSKIIEHPNAIFHELSLPSAREMGLLALDKFKKDDFEDLAYFNPSYLKDFQGTKI